MAFTVAEGRVTLPFPATRQQISMHLIATEHAASWRAFRAILISRNSQVSAELTGTKLSVLKITTFDVIVLVNVIIVTRLLWPIVFVSLSKDNLFRRFSMKLHLPLVKTLSQRRELVNIYGVQRCIRVIIIITFMFDVLVVPWKRIFLFVPLGRFVCTG